MSQWQGGKGSGRRKGQDDAKYRDNWGEIFGGRSNSNHERDSNRKRTDPTVKRNNTGSNVSKT